MKLKDLTAILTAMDMPAPATVEQVAERAGCEEAEVLRVAREGIALGYLEVRRMDAIGTVVTLTPLGAERERVVLLDVRVLRGDEWAEEPRWMSVELAWWLLRDIASLGYPVSVEEEDEDRPRRDDGDPNQMEPLEYLILSEDSEKRRAVDGTVLPYPLHFLGYDRPWPLAVQEGPGLDPTKGLAADGTDGPCPACGRHVGDPVGYCAHCDAYGCEASLPRVTRRPRAHRAQLDPRRSLAGGKGPSRTVQRFWDRNKGKADGRRVG